jgi:type I restriction enzyme S subunit
MIEVKKQFTIRKSQLEKKFRVENNNIDFTSLIESTGYNVDRIGKLAKSHRNERDRKKTANNIIKYVQISDIDVHLGAIKSYRKFKGSEAPNNARRIMNYGDVLVSTRRPTRGAAVAVPKEFDKEICTVFFTTLTVTNWDVLDPRYLALFLRTSIGRIQFQAQITETAYPVIADIDVENMTVIYPDIDVQRQIADKYSTAVKTFFDTINLAYTNITSAQQDIENFILKEDAEIIIRKELSLATEEVSDEESDEVVVENDPQ